MDGNILMTLAIVIPVLLVSMSIHETMHGLAALWLGDETAKDEGRISINPIKHIDPFLTIALPALLAVIGAPIFGAAKPVNIDMRSVRWGEFGGAIIGMIGPISNLVIAIIAALLLRNFEIFQSGLLLEILRFTLLINVGFFIFNSIPFPPLDGSRLLYAFAPEPVQRFMDSIEQFGLVGFFIFMLLFFQFLSPVIGRLSSMLTAGLLGI